MSGDNLLLKRSIDGLESSVEYIINDEKFDMIDIKNLKDITEIDNYVGIIIIIETETPKYSFTKFEKITVRDDKPFAFIMTQQFKDDIKNSDYPYPNNIGDINSLFIKRINREYYSFTNYMKLNKTIAINLKRIILVKPKSSGGKKAVVKYTVKDLQAIAIENNIKITKKVEGKTVRLNKQEMIAKLKRHKLI